MRKIINFFKKTFNHGLGSLVPIVLTTVTLVWIYGIFKNLTLLMMPGNWEFKWWFPIIVLFGIIVSIFIIGLIFRLIRPIRWVKNTVEKQIIRRIPAVNKIYEFGLELSDSFLGDFKNDGDLAVVSVPMFGGRSLGIVSNSNENVIFVPTAPNPTNGFVIWDTPFDYVDMSSTEAIKFVTSLGKLNAYKIRKILKHTNNKEEKGK